MIQVTPQMRILICIEPVDFRCGIDGLCQICRQVLSTDPFSGAVVVFRSRRGTAIRLLTYDGQGFWLCTKRLSKGQFRYWPRRDGERGPGRQLLVHQLQVLLAGGDPESTQAAPQWRPITPASAAAPPPDDRNSGI